MKRPRLNILRTFEAAGRQLSFSQASTDLNISQAAVSQQIRQLEDYLEQKLFIRHHRRLTLTGTGQAYLHAVSEALDRLDSITDQLFPGRQQQSVSVSCSSSIATLWLAPNLCSLQKYHPTIDLRIKTLDSNYDNANWSTANLDIFIKKKASTEPNIDQLLTATIVPVCAPKLLNQQQRPTQPDAVLKHELIHILGYDDDWHRWFRNHGLKDIAVPRGFSVDGSLIAIEAAQRGDGIMLGRRPFIDRHLLSGELMEVFSKPYHLYTKYYLRQSTQTTNRHTSDIVADWLKKLAADTAL